MKQAILVHDVQWDDEGKSGLPNTVTIDTPDFIPASEEEMNDYISDKLSETYGYCHFGWEGYRYTTNQQTA